MERGSNDPFFIPFSRKAFTDIDPDLFSLSGRFPPVFTARFRKHIDFLPKTFQIRIKNDQKPSVFIEFTKFCKGLTIRNFVSFAPYNL